VHTGERQPPRDRGARFGPVHAERRRLGGDQVDREIEAVADRALGGQQRELVKRQHPGRARHGDQGDPAAPVAPQALDRVD
jgi:hypothetical protein